jgi:hypothetical protein
MMESEVREIFSPEHIKHRARVHMIENQHEIWRRKFYRFVDFLEQQDPEDFGPHFAAQRQVVTQLYELCRDPATFDAHCTRENLRIICDFTARIAGNTVNEPDWMYVVTQMHLFVLEAECRRWQQGDRSFQAMRVDGANPSEHLHDPDLRLDRMNSDSGVRTLADMRMLID